MFYAMLHDIDL